MKKTLLCTAFAAGALVLFGPLAQAQYRIQRVQYLRPVPPHFYYAPGYRPYEQLYEPGGLDYYGRPVRPSTDGSGR